MTLDDQVQTLIECLRKDDPDKLNPNDVLDFILLDSNQDIYQGRFDPGKYSKMGIETVSCRLTNESGQPFIKEQNFVESVLSFV